MNSLLESGFVKTSLYIAETIKLSNSYGGCAIITSLTI